MAKKTKKKVNDTPLTPRQAMAKVLAIQVEVGKGELGIKEACEKHHLKLHKYSYWAKKLKDEEGNALADAVKEAKWDVVHDSSPAAIKERLDKIKALEKDVEAWKYLAEARLKNIEQFKEQLELCLDQCVELRSENARLKEKILEYVLKA